MRGAGKINWVVVAGLIAVSILLGVLNNFRVYEEQRIPWSGYAGDGKIVVEEK